MDKILVACTRFLCMHKILVHAQDSGTQTVFSTQYSEGTLKVETGTGRDRWGPDWIGYRNIVGAPTSIRHFWNILHRRVAILPGTGTSPHWADRESTGLHKESIRYPYRTFYAVFPQSMIFGKYL